MNEYDELTNTLNILLFSLMAPFIFCFCGNILTKQGEALHRASFESLWYQVPLKEKKSFLTLMIITKAELLQFRYFQSMIIGMPSFAGIIQGTYTYSAAIFSLENR